MNFHENHWSPQERRDYLKLWAVVLIGPIAWLLQLQIVYSVLPHTCDAVDRLWLHLPAIPLLAATALAGWLAWHIWRGQGPCWPTDADEIALLRTRFMAVLGLMTTSLFLWVMLAQSAVASIVDSCE